MCLCDITSSSPDMSTTDPVDKIQSFAVAGSVVNNYRIPAAILPPGNVANPAGHDWLHKSHFQISRLASGTRVVEAELRRLKL